MKCLFFCLLAGVPLWASDSPTLVYFVRHAEKQPGSRDPWLSKAGLQRVNALDEFFKHNHLDAIFATEYLRTQQTVAALAHRRGMEVQVISAFFFDDLLAEVRDRPGQTLLVAGHSNTVPYLLWLLGAPPFAIEDDQYDNIFLMILAGDTCTFQRFKVRADDFDADGGSYWREIETWRLGVLKY